MMILFLPVAVLTGIYLTIYVAYDMILVAARFFLPDTRINVAGGTKRFLILIPAHNERLLIGRILESIKGIEYPREKFDTIVVADNCTDDTADIARSFNVKVIERTDKEHIGKGYAIRFGIERTDLNNHDALFIVDADSIVDRKILYHLNKDLVRGEGVIQCYNGVANPESSWLTRLLNVSRTIANEILYPAKDRLGLSVNLMGNGMCFSCEVLKNFGWEAFSLGEDWEYFAMLVSNGQRVAFDKMARVYHQESTTLEQATSQRLRWSSGRFSIMKQGGLKLLYKGLARKDINMVDAALTLLLPNPSLGMNISFVFLILSVFVTPGAWGFFLNWAVLIIAVQLLIFLMGVLYTKKRLKNFLSLFVTPVFLLWKMFIDIISIAGIGNQSWTRTDRRL